MTKKISFLSCFLVLVFLCSAAAIAFAQPEDSMWISSVDPVPPDTTVTVDVRVKLTQPVVAIQIPLTFRNENNLEVELDSIHWSDWLWNSEPWYIKDSIHNVDKWMYAVAIWIWGYFPEGDTTLFTMSFTTSPYWDPNRTVVIDSFTKENSPQIEPFQLVFLDTTGWPQADSIIPGFVAGTLGPGLPPGVGDVNGDRRVSIPDVVYLINYILRDGPPPFHALWAGDVNCDGEVDIIDVVYLINYLFRGGPPPGDPDNDGVPDC